MRIDVVVTGWEQECCGDPFAVGSTVEWQILAADPAEIPPGRAPRFLEEHHGQTPADVPHLAVSGVVVSITAVDYPLLLVPGEVRSFTMDTAHPRQRMVGSVASETSVSDDYLVELDIDEVAVLPGYVLSAETISRRAADERVANRDRKRMQDSTGELLEQLADEAQERFGAVTRITRDPLRSAITIEPRNPGAAAMRWARSGDIDDGITAHVGEGSWVLPGSAESADTVRALLEAAAAGRVSERVVPVDDGRTRLDTVIDDERGGRSWTSSTEEDSFAAAEGSRWVVASGYGRIVRGDVTYSPWA